MKKHAEDSWPESSPEYIAGLSARLNKKTRDACPYGGCALFHRSTWLAGWHDMDMTMGRRRIH